MNTEPGGIVRVHIDELYVEGLRAGDQERFGRAFRAELSRLLSTRGLNATIRGGGSSDRIDAGEIHTGRSLAVSSVAIHAARAVYSNLGNGRKI